MKKNFEKNPFPVKKVEKSELALFFLSPSVDIYENSENVHDRTNAQSFRRTQIRNKIIPKYVRQKFLPKISIKINNNQGPYNYW
jgi:hypothetical protein